MTKGRTYSPSWNVLAIHPKHASSDALRFVRLHTTNAVHGNGVPRNNVAPAHTRALHSQTTTAVVAQDASFREFDALMLRTIPVCCALGVSLIAIFKAEEEREIITRPPTGTSYRMPSMLVETLASTHALRSNVADPPPIALFTTPGVASWIRTRPKKLRSLWDRVEEFDLVAARAALRAVDSRGLWEASSWDMYLWKLVCLLRSPFNQTLYFDTDLYVISPTFASDLLHNTLHTADLAFATEVKRGGDVMYSGVAPYVLNPPQSARGAPAICSCLVAWRRTPSTIAFWRRVIVRMSRNLARAPYSRSFPPGQGYSSSKLRGVRLKLTPLLEDLMNASLRVRPGDQEFMQAELMRGPSDPHLRLAMLPEEYYCPVNSFDPPVLAHSRSLFRSKTDDDPIRLVRGREKQASCHAIHGHIRRGVGGSRTQLSIQLDKLRPGSPALLVDAEGWFTLMLQLMHQ